MKNSMGYEPPTLLTLPWDIRLQILEYLLRSPTALSRVTRTVKISRFGSTTSQRKHDTTHWRFEAGGQLDLHPSIISVCQQLYREGVDILYNANTVLIHVALYSNFTPVDILGHWRFEDFADRRSSSSSPPPGARLPLIERFRNFEFCIFVDFTRHKPWYGNKDLWSLCRLIGRGGAGMLGKVTVNVVDGSNGTRYRGEKYFGLWEKLLDGFRGLKCRELKVEGDVPTLYVERLESWMLCRTMLGVSDGDDLRVGEGG